MAAKSNKPTDIALLFNSSTSTLAQIQKKTKSITTLEEIIRKICYDLPENVWKIVNFKQQTITIEVNSAVWSQRLQFERNNICRELARQTNNHFTHIDIKVRPLVNHFTQKNNNNENTIKRKKIPLEAAENFLAISKNAPSGLKEKLEKLASHAEKTNKQ